MHSVLCSNCGKPLPVGAAFCGDCGAPQKPTTQNTPTPVATLTPGTPRPATGGATLRADALPSGDNAPNQLPLPPASHSTGPMNPGGSGPGSSGPSPKYPPIPGPQTATMPPPAYTPGGGGSSSSEKQTKERAFSFGNIIALSGLILTIIGLLITLNVIHPFSPKVTPTPTPNLQAFTSPRIACQSDNTFDLKTLWLQDGLQSTTYDCNATGMVITEAPKASTNSSAALSLPLPHEPLTRNYSISVQISDLASPQSCAGVIFRHSGYRAYVVGLCLNGVWYVAKSFATNGTVDVVNHGTYTIKQENSYLLLVEVSNDTATISIEDQPLPSLTLDPTFQDKTIDLYVDGGDPLSTSIDPSTNPGASATFSQFKFQPLG